MENVETTADRNDRLAHMLLGYCSDCSRMTLANMGRNRDNKKFSFLVMVILDGRIHDITLTVARLCNFRMQGNEKALLAENGEQIVDAVNAQLKKRGYTNQFTRHFVN